MCLVWISTNPISFKTCASDEVECKSNRGQTHHQECEELFFLLKIHLSFPDVGVSLSFYTAFSAPAQSPKKRPPGLSISYLIPSRYVQKGDLILTQTNTKRIHSSEESNHFILCEYV